MFRRDVSERINEKLFVPPQIKPGEKTSEPLVYRELKYLIFEWKLVNEKAPDAFKDISVFYFHANNENIFACQRRLFHAIDLIGGHLKDKTEMSYVLRLYLFEYPGYNEGEEGTTKNMSNPILEEWCAQLYAFMFENTIFSREKVCVLWGYSVGCGFVCRLLNVLMKRCAAKEFPWVAKHDTRLPNVILQAPFYSVINTVKRAGWFYSVMADLILEESQHEYFDIGKILEQYSTFKDMTTFDDQGVVQCYTSPRDETCGPDCRKFTQLWLDGLVDVTFVTSNNHIEFINYENMQLVTHNLFEYVLKKLCVKEYEVV